MSAGRAKAYGVPVDPTYWPELDEVRELATFYNGTAARDDRWYAGLGIYYKTPTRTDGGPRLNGYVTHYRPPAPGRREAETARRCDEITRQWHDAERARLQTLTPALVYFSAAAWAANVAYNRAAGVVEYAREQVAQVTKAERYPAPARADSQSPAPPIPAWATGVQWNAERGEWEYARD